MEPIDASSRWRGWSVSGTPVKIDGILTRLDQSLSAGWRRLTDREVIERGLNPFRSASSYVSPVWFSLDATPDHVAAVVTVDRIQDTHLRGGIIWFGDGCNRAATPVGESDWAPILQFLDGAIVPAARAVGATVKAPGPEDIFFAELPLEVRDHLRAFSDSARKTLSLNSAESEKWRELVVAAFRARTVIDSRLFVNWLAREGWSRESADELNLLFFDQCLLLSRYTEELQVV